jgi:hypothetical protein
MAEEQELRASHEEVEGFVAKLRDFHGSLNDSEQAMMESVLASAQGETGDYQRIRRRSGDQGWEDLVGWIEEKGDEDTQGFVRSFSWDRAGPRDML